MPSIEIAPGRPMAYRDDCFREPWLTAEPVVMVHGNAESAQAWTCWVPALARHFRVIRPDLPGLGASPAPDGYGWTAPELARDILAFADALRLSQFHLIGAKYGGSACLRLAIDKPERLLSLALFGAPVRGSGSGNADLIRAHGTREWASRTQRARLGSGASDTQIAWWTDELMGKADAHAAYSASAARIDMELEHELAGITAPVLIVSTQESGLQTVEAVNRYAARMPDARVVIVPGDSYHIAAVEPDACAARALAFLQEVSQRADKRRSR